MNIVPLLSDPAFQRLAGSAISEFCKNVREITYIEHGDDNIVALVNQEYVFRFPRNEAAAKRLTYETALLQKIGGNLHAMVDIPTISKVHTQPLYVVSRYIEGEHLRGSQIQQLSQEEQAAIGRKIAVFVAQFNQVISGLEIQRLRTEAGVEGLRPQWEAYFEGLFVTSPLPNMRLQPVVNEYYAMWKDYVSHEQRTYAIHDDLHEANLLFLGSQLNGIVDFSETNVGSIEEELRWLYPMGDIVLNAAIAQYQSLTNSTIDYNHVRTWAVIQTLANYIKRFINQETDSRHFLRAQDYLRKWIPNFPL
jgi:aminoglycoside 2''-phosphotransferase